MIALLLCACLAWQAPTDAQDTIGPRLQGQIESTIQLLARQNANASLGDQITAAGTLLLGVPYVAGSLERPEKEALTIRLDGFDCWTLMETAISLARSARLHGARLHGARMHGARMHGAIKAYQQILQSMRYRDGRLDDYASRLHYTVDWAANGIKQGLLRDMTQSLGGTPRDKTIAFMSAHPDSYPALDRPGQLAKIKAVEAAINQRQHWMIPTDRVRNVESAIQDGDIIAIATSIPLLDVQHVGLAIHQNGRLHLLHASSKNGQVEISAKPLADWLKQSRTAEGIMVYRPLPKK